MPHSDPPSRSDFDAASEAARVRAERTRRRRRRTWGKSVLEPHRHELIALHQAGLSYADLAFWLRKEVRIKVDRSTVRRFLAKHSASPSASSPPSPPDAELPPP